MTTVFPLLSWFLLSELQHLLHRAKSAGNQWWEDRLEHTSLAARSHWKLGLHVLTLTRRLVLVDAFTAASAATVLPNEALLLISARTLRLGRSCMQWFSPLILILSWLLTWKRGSWREREAAEELLQSDRTFRGWVWLLCNGTCLSSSKLRLSALSSQHSPLTVFFEYFLKSIFTFWKRNSQFQIKNRIFFE